MESEPRGEPERQALGLARWLGAVGAGLGGVFLTGWLFNQPILRSLFPGQVEAKANTAVCFLLAGLALALKAAPDRGPRGPRVVAANLGAALAALTGLLTLGEYILGWNLGIDELLFRDAAGAADTVYPGRMALPTALNFVLLGAAVILVQPSRDRAILAWLVVPVVGLAGLAFVGQLYGIPYLASFGPFTPIAAPTGCAFVILSAGVLLAGTSRFVAKLRHSGLLLGFGVAVVLLFAMGGAVLHNTQALIRNTRQVTRSQEVLGRLTGVLSAVQDVETGSRGYLLAGDPAFLEPYGPAPATARRLLQELRNITADDSAGQTQLVRLEALINSKIELARLQVEMRRNNRTEAARESVASREGQRLMDAIRAVVEDMRQEESRLLRERQARLEAGTQRTLLTLGLGLTITVGLLLTVFVLLRQEIARSARTQAALLESETRYRTLFNSIDEGFCIIEMIFDERGKPADYRFLEINQSFERQTGLHDAQGRRMRELAPQHEAHWFEIYGRIAQTGEPERFQNRAEQLHRTYDVYAFRFGDPARRQVAILFNDITARQQAEERLRRSEENLSVTLGSIGDAVMATDTAGCITRLNPVAEKLTGWPEAEARGRPVAEVFRIIHEDTRTPAPIPVDEVLATGEIKGLANHAALIARDGTERAIADSAAPIRDRDGRVLGVVLVFRDVTETRRAQQELDRFFSLSLDFLCIAGMDGHFKRVSPAVTDILGWTVEEFLARPYLDMIHPDDRAASLREIERQAAGHRVMHFENRFPHKDGSWRVLSWRSMPHGGMMYATARDVTELKQTEERIRRLNADLRQRAAQLESANKELEAFSYSVSHDLRAPLRHVQGYVEMLAREAQAALSDKSRRYLQTITDAAREMGELIDDLLAFSRMGRAEMQETAVDLGELIGEVRRGLAAASQGRDIRWKVAALPRVRGDAAMLRQVLVNLLGNAVKYTRPRATAEIEIGCAGEEQGRIIFYVRDNGAGYDMQYAGKLFGVFQRLHRADEFEGTGIGLASVRRIITRHGGRTWAEGRVDAGATFYFTLAAAPADQSDSTSPRP